MAYTFGLSQILVADVLESGLMPEESAMVKIGEVLENTGSITQEAATFTDFKEQGNSNAKVRIKTEGAFTFAFQIMNAEPALLAEYIGGEVVDGAWHYVGESMNVEKALLIKPDQGLSFAMPKASISATIGGELNRENLVTVTFEVTPLSPGDNKPSLISKPIGGNVASVVYYGGALATLPASSAAAKTALITLQATASGNSFTFLTGTANKNFLFAIPEDKNPSLIINQTTTEPLTSEFEAVASLNFANDTGVNYKVYKMVTAVAFSSENTIKVTV